MTKVPVLQGMMRHLYGPPFQRAGTFWLSGIVGRTRVKVSADGRGVVSYAGVGRLRELADLAGLSARVAAVLTAADNRPWVHPPGDAFADLAAAVADGAHCIDGVGQLLGDRAQALGPLGSATVLWRLVDHFGSNGNAAATGKTFGFHPLPVFWTASTSSAGLLRPGNVGSDTAIDRISVLDQVLAALPVAFGQARTIPMGITSGDIREGAWGAEVTDLRDLPFHSFEANSAWPEIIMAAADLVSWVRLIGFIAHSDLACCEIATFRYRVLHVAARTACVTGVPARWQAPRTSKETHPPKRHPAPWRTHPPESASPAGHRNRLRPVNRTRAND